MSGTFHVIHVRTDLTTANYPIDSFHLDKHGIAVSTKNQHSLVVIPGEQWQGLTTTTNCTGASILRNAICPTKDVRSGLTFTRLLEGNSACGAKTSKTNPEPVTLCNFIIASNWQSESRTCTVLQDSFAQHPSTKLRLPECCCSFACYEPIILASKCCRFN